MRLWGKSNPTHFSLPHIKEQVLTEVGGAGNFGTSKLRRRYQKDTPGQKLKTFTSDSITGSAKSGPGAGSNSMSDNGSVGGLSEPVSVWTCKEEVRQRFLDKYGSEGDTRLLRVARRLSEMDSMWPCPVLVSILHPEASRIPLPRMKLDQTPLPIAKRIRS